MDHTPARNHSGTMATSPGSEDSTVCLTFNSDAQAADGSGNQRASSTNANMQDTQEGIESGIQQWQDPYGPRVSPPRGNPPALYAPSLPLLPDHLHQFNNSIQDIVHLLMNPEKDLINFDDQIVKLHITWAVGKVGPERFEYRHEGPNPRLVLRHDSDLSEHGLEAGLLKKIWDWLLGDPLSDELVLEMGKLNISKSKDREDE